VRLLTENRIVEALRTFQAALMRMSQTTLEAARWNHVATLACGGEQQDFRLLGQRIGLESDICFIFDRSMLVPCDSAIETLADLELFVLYTGLVRRLYATTRSHVTSTA
jgi:hypothetical protein